jgi:hypothetical protein
MSDYGYAWSQETEVESQEEASVFAFYSIFCLVMNFILANLAEHEQGRQK